MHTRTHSDSTGHAHGQHTHRRRHHGRRKGGRFRGEGDGEVRLVLLALIATGLRDGRLSLAPAPDGRNFEVRATGPAGLAMLPPSAADEAPVWPDLVAADPAALAPVLAALPQGRRRRGKGGPRPLTAISRR